MSFEVGCQWREESCFREGKTVGLAVDKSVDKIWFLVEKWKSVVIYDHTFCFIPSTAWRMCSLVDSSLATVSTPCITVV